MNRAVSDAVIAQITHKSPQVAHQGALIYARHFDIRFNHRVLRGCASVRAFLRKAEVTPMDLTTIVVVVLTVLLLGYLVFTLLRPEKF